MSDLIVTGTTFLSICGGIAIIGGAGMVIRDGRACDINNIP